MTFLLAGFALQGCGKQRGAPAREELVQLLGDLESDVKVLGSELHTQRRNTGNSNSPDMAVQELATKLWVVRSNNALPIPRPQTENQTREIESASAVQYSVEAYSARILYDIASALRIRETELPLPDPDKLETAKGRLTEWSKSPWRIRIRDFQTDTGWLSVVEAFPE